VLRGPGWAYAKHKELDQRSHAGDEAAALAV
jgi:hypothetical protein